MMGLCIIEGDIQHFPYEKTESGFYWQNRYILPRLFNASVLFDLVISPTPLRYFDYEDQ
jgi:hypothetical protein